MKSNKTTNNFSRKHHNKKDLIDMYYIKEYSIKNIADKLKCSKETVRRKCRMYQLPLRDRRWTEEDVVTAIRLITNECDGINLKNDIEKIAQKMLRKSSDVLSVVANCWLKMFAPNIDYNHFRLLMASKHKPLN